MDLKKNFFINQRNEIKKLIRDMLENTNATEQEIVNAMSEQFGYKHSTLFSYIEECKGELGDKIHDRPK